MALPQRLTRGFIDFLDRHAAAGRSLAVVTVVGTEGSTYSKSGTQILVNEDGDYCGMVSGGCLEGDLADRARRAIASGEPSRCDYDLRVDDDVFGLGIGCEGLIRVAIQPLSSADDHAPLAAAIRGERSFPVLGDDHELAELWLRPPPAILLLGGGADVRPLVGLCGVLGWDVTVNDHRPAYVDALAGLGIPVLCGPPGDTGERIDAGDVDAAIVMSHHLASDREYLRWLASTTVPFVGLLGPPHRRDRLLQEIGPAADALAARLHAPVGARIGGRGPAAIALEVVAELQRFLTARD